MTKNFKLVLALIVAVIMIVGSISAIAAPGDLAKDPSIKITGLEKDDTVNLYKVLEWIDGAGWRLTSNFASLNNENVNKLVTALTSTTAPTSVTLTREDVEAITTIARGLAAADDTMTANASGEASKDVEVGMYLALTIPNDPDVVYNPIIVSADFSTTNTTSEINASNTMMGSSTVAKKETVTLNKEAPDITLNIDEPVKFTVTTTIPAYAKSTLNPSFVMADQLSAGIAYVVDNDAHKFEVKATNDADSAFLPAYTGGPTDGATNFTLTFDSTGISNLNDALPITVTYWAKITDTAPLNINEKTNDVTVTFTNNPKDSSAHGHLKDEVKEYTFTIDGNLLGISSYRTGELVKIGQDAQGKDILESKELSNTTSHSALAGATFGLYTTKAAADAATGVDSTVGLYNNTKFTGIVTTDEKGLMTINGLKAGTYYLKELDAPDGFIKDPATHEIYITYTTTTVTVTGETVGDGCTYPDYDVEVLDSYTVIIDSSNGGTSSTYTMTLSGPVITSATSSDLSTELKNIKGVELPSTGGIGTTIFYVGGSLMVLAAAILLITKRRMGVED